MSDHNEHPFVKTSIGNFSHGVGITYKPPRQNYKEFVDTLKTSLILAMSHADHVICMGDVNINFSNTDYPSTTHFNKMLSSVEMKQLIFRKTLRL